MSGYVGCSSGKESGSGVKESNGEAGSFGSYANESLGSSLVAA